MMTNTLTVVFAALLCVQLTTAACSRTLSAAQQLQLTSSPTTLTGLAEDARVTWTPKTGTRNTNGGLDDTNDYACHDASSTCKNGCLWVPTCMVTSCKVPADSTGATGVAVDSVASRACVAGKNVRSGTTCTFKQATTSTAYALGTGKGSSFVAATTSTCTDGQWTAAIQNVMRDCTANLPAVTGATVSCDKFTSGGVCTFTKTTGFASCTQLSRTCSMGQWSGTDTVCTANPVACPNAPVVIGATTASKDACKNKASGESCTLVVDTTTHTSCLQPLCTNGVWSRQTCTEKPKTECTVPANPLNAAPETTSTGCADGNKKTAGQTCVYAVTSATTHGFIGSATSTCSCNSTSNTCAMSTVTTYKKGCAGLGAYVGMWYKHSTTKPCTTAAAEGATCDMESADTTKYTCTATTLTCTKGAWVGTPQCSVKAITSKTCTLATVTGATAPTAPVLWANQRTFTTGTSNKCGTNTESGGKCTYTQTTAQAAAYSCTNLDVTCTNGVMTAPTCTAKQCEIKSKYLVQGDQWINDNTVTAAVQASSLGGMLNRALGGTAVTYTSTSSASNYLTYSVQDMTLAQVQKQLSNSSNPKFSLVAATVKWKGNFMYTKLVTLTVFTSACDSMAALFKNSLTSHMDTISAAQCGHANALRAGYVTKNGVNWGESSASVLTNSRWVMGVMASFLVMALTR